MREFNRFISHIYTSIPTGDASEYLRDCQAGSWQPSADLLETQDSFLVVIELPGVSKDQIEATVQHGILRISGCRMKELPENIEHVHQMEIPYGTFSRSIRLPQNVHVDRIEAEYEDGYLTVTIPKPSSASGVNNE
jgi:HSP20 family protein